MKNRSKQLVMKGLISSSLLLTMGGAIAHSIGSQHTHQAVPLSLTSTIVLGILLIFTGLFILPRMQGRHIRTLATTTLLAGIIAAGVGGKLITDTYALASNDCDINNGNSTTGCPVNIPQNQNILITNLSSDDIIVDPVQDSIQASQIENRGLKIELVKGPLKRSVVMSQPTCVFPQTLVPGAACQFNHAILHAAQ